MNRSMTVQACMNIKNMFLTFYTLFWKTEHESVMQLCVNVCLPLPPLSCEFLSVMNHVIATLDSTHALTTGAQQINQKVKLIIRNECGLLAPFYYVPCKCSGQ